MSSRFVTQQQIELILSGLPTLTRLANLVLLIWVQILVRLDSFSYNIKMEV